MKKHTLIALVLLGFACALTVWRVGAFSDSVITHGTVSKYETIEDEDGTTYRMYVVYMDYNDEKHEWEAGFSSSVQPYDVGAAIPVEYDRSNPFDAAPVYMHPFNSWGLIWATITAALSLLLMPIFSRKPQRILDENRSRAHALHRKRKKKHHHTDFSASDTTP